MTVRDGSVFLGTGDRASIVVVLSRSQSERAHMAAILGGRATNERVKCLRIFSDGDGETHLEDMDVKLRCAHMALSGHL